ncbi:YcjF family protein [Antarctobacter jejuensis]|uniref:YcjF family protein n=1 Tax=Antarctobacter jejuensis TaxID=1439938 RepID=UPI003FD67123
MATSRTTTKTEKDAAPESERAAPETEVAEIEINDMEVRAIIDRHVLIASGVGLVPIPLVDLAGVAVVQISMIKKLAELHGVDYSQRRARSIISALIGGSIPAVGALPLFSLAQSIPVIGWTVGAGAASILSGASTYAVGHVMAGHFANGGDVNDFNAEKAKASFGELFERGKDRASRLASRKKAEGTDGAEATAAT